MLFVNPQWGAGTPSYVRMGDPRGKFRWVDTMMPAASIRFLAENYPGTECLEYPTWEEYTSRVRAGVDVVAVSFYTYQMAEAARMVAFAREQGVREVWGGGWGIETPGARALFDRSFAGYGEEPLLPILGDRRGGEGWRHPVLLGEARFLGLRSKVGYLYSIRGCKYKCEYCPTPAFIPNRRILPLAEIERVLDIYARERVGCVIIWDETFLSDREYSWRIVEMLKERGLLWFCLTSSAELVGNVSRLRDSGFIGCLIGIESLRDTTLREYRRGRFTNLNLRAIHEMHDNSCWLVASYLLCHDLDTPKSMRADVEKLASLELQGVNPCILTPYAPTPLYERYRSRIVDWDWRHWDDGHLVWKHPNVGAEEAREILLDCIYACSGRSRNYAFMAQEALGRLIPFKIRAGHFHPARFADATRRSLSRRPSAPVPAWPAPVATPEPREAGA